MEYSTESANCFGDQCGAVPPEISGLFPISVAILYRLTPFTARWLPKVWPKSRQLQDGPADRRPGLVACDGSP
jgi:hypothetical protein